MLEQVTNYNIKLLSMDKQSWYEKLSQRIYGNERKREAKQYFSSQSHQPQYKHQPQYWYKYENQKKENYQEDFSDLGSYSEGNQASIPYQIDKRVKVPFDMSNEYPYCSIVRIIVIQDKLSVAHSIKDFKFGTGVIINPRVIFTVAHNVYKKFNNRDRDIHNHSSMDIEADVVATIDEIEPEKVHNQIPDHIFVQVQISAKEKKLVRVVKFGFQKNYLNPKDKKPNNSQQYDLAILILEKNSVIKPQMAMKMSQDCVPQINETQIMLSGFPLDRNKEQKQDFYQYFCTTKPKYISGNFVIYPPSGSSGQSGSPLLIRSNQDKSRLQLIGLHKGSYGVNSQGIILRHQNNKQIILKALKLNLQNPKNMDMVQKAKRQTQTLENQIDRLPSWNIFVSIGKINWVKMRLGQASLHSFIVKKSQGSFRNLLNDLKELLTQINQNNPKGLLLGQTASEFLLSNFQTLYFSQSDQIKYLTIIHQYLNVNLKLKNLIKKKQEDQFDFCGKIGYCLRILHQEIVLNNMGKIYPWQKTRNITLYKRVVQATLNEMSTDVKKKGKQLIQILIKNKDIKVADNLRQKDLIEREMNFLLNFKQLNNTNTYIEMKKYSIQQSGDERVLMIFKKLEKSIQKFPKVPKVVIHHFFRFFKLNPDDFDIAGNKTFPENFSQIKTRGGWPYYQPERCKRYGLSVSGKYDGGSDRWLQKTGQPGEWAIAYHGIRSPKSICQNFGGISTLSYIMSGLEEGNMLRTGPQQAYMYQQATNKDEKETIGQGIYLTPQFQDTFPYIDRQDEYGVILQCRVNPKYIKVCSIQSLWVINDTKNIRPYGIILIKRKIRSNYPNFELQFGKSFNYNDYKQNIEKYINSY